MPYHPQAIDRVPNRGGDVATLTVDNHAVFREALRDLIAATRGFVLVGEACSGEEALREVDRLSPQLVIVDVLMPGMGGIAATRVLLNRHPELVVLLVSMDDPSLHIGATELGSTVALARKQDLRSTGLTKLWERHRNVNPDAG
jgi:DNA-binding NarL/FixJ family response regulator